MAAQKGDPALACRWLSPTNGQPPFRNSWGRLDEPPVLPSPSITTRILEIGLKHAKVQYSRIVGRFLPPTVHV